MNDASSQLVTPVILSGGAGSRLWPMSTSARPKQMLALIGDEAMLHRTATRVSDRGLYLSPVVIAGVDQAEAVEKEVEEIGTLILEPVPRNTAGAIALAAVNAPPEAVLLVLPSDHLIRDSARFDDAVRRALPFAKNGWIVTFGMSPDRPETGYGYILRGRELADGVHVAECFVEKPDAQTARRFLAEGGYDWNGGIFLMRAGTAMDELETHAPAILAAARGAMARRSGDGNRIVPDRDAFAAAPSISIDHALMEKADRVAVVPVSVGWSDIGSWQALHEVAEKDAAGNALAGEVAALDTRGCLIRSDGPIVTAVGVDDLVIVATADAVLVVPRSQSQRVKEVVDLLKAEGRHTGL